MLGMNNALSGYLANNHKTTTQFASEIGVTHSAVVKWMQGKCIPRPPIMARITAATGGLVTAADFYAAPLPDNPSQGVPASAS